MPIRPGPTARRRRCYPGAAEFHRVAAGRRQQRACRRHGLRRRGARRPEGFARLDRRFPVAPPAPSTSAPGAPVSSADLAQLAKAELDIMAEHGRALAYCHAVFERGHLTPVAAALAGAARFFHWRHYPEGDAHDPTCLLYT